MAIYQVLEAKKQSQFKANNRLLAGKLEYPGQN